MPALADLVARSLDGEHRERFDRRVREQAAAVRDAIERGALDSPGYAVGLELEVYAVDGDGRLATLPDGVYERCNKELGCHNAELNLEPTPFDGPGLDALADGVADAVAAAREAFADAGRACVLDAMWTVPPAGGTEPYLSAVDTVDGMTVATNMRASARYCALDNDVLARRGGTVTLDLPGYTGAFPTILPESLASSMQPHLQVPAADAFPRYYNAAIRTMAPVLALSTNSPFLPADLYPEGADPDRLLAATAHELRVPVFEQSINAGDAKVSFPRDIESAADVVTRIEEDATRAPFLREWVEDDEPAGFREDIWEFDHKRGTYWRWLRGIPGGQPVGGGTERSLRIEYRPLPTQPTVADTVGLLALTVGLVRGLVAADHPLATLDWEASRDSFYDVVERGLDADLAWVTAAGDRTSNPDVVFGEVFEYARHGLEAAGLPEAAADEYLAPIEARWDARRTPSRWKLSRVRSSLDDGASLADAIAAMQREYNDRSAAGTPFAAWD
ncbi:MAG: hypothetical protein ABEJ92_08180 [Halobacteriales archaeon]